MHSVIKLMGIKNPGQLHWLWLSILMMVLDQASKLLANSQLGFHIPVEILPIFNLNLTHNPGAAWSILSDASGWQRWFFLIFAIIVSGILVSWLKNLAADEKLSAIAFAMVIGGALGNAVDRIVHGYVIDFIQFHYHGWYFPTFNIADSAITIGVTLMLWDSFVQQRKQTGVTE